MDYIYTYNNLISKNTCDELINYFESNSQEHFKGLLGSLDPSKKLNLDIKNCDEMYLDDNIEIEILNRIKPHFDQYNTKHTIGETFIFDRQRIKRYLNNDNEYFKLHTDISNIGNCRRIVAYILYLNDVAEGGETHIIFDKKDINIKPEAGKLLIFPANFCFPHEGKKPISNSKYILVGFVNYA